LHTAGELKSLVFFLKSVKLLNGKVCEYHFAIELFELVNSFDTIG